MVRVMRPSSLCRRCYAQNKSSTKTLQAPTEDLPNACLEPWITLKFIKLDHRLFM